MENEQIISKLKQLEHEIAELKSNRGLKAFLRKSFSKLNVIIGIICTIMISSLVLYAAQAVFTDGEIISAGEVNANFTELYDKAAELLNKVTAHDTAIARAASIRDMSRGLIIKNNETNPGGKREYMVLYIHNIKRLGDCCPAFGELGRASIAGRI